MSNEIELDCREASLDCGEARNGSKHNKKEYMQQRIHKCEASKGYYINAKHEPPDSKPKRTSWLGKMMH
jgi:hypothetical protein